MPVEIAPSLLSADFGAFRDAAQRCLDAGVKRLHFDIMDGAFVPNFSFGAQLVKALRPLSGAVYEAHLMIREPDRFAPDFIEAGADIVTIHYEAAVHVQRALARIRELGARAGLALNPATPLDALDYLMDDVDLLLIMTVNPGFGGQQLLPATVRKLAEARQRIDRSGRSIDLEADGGVGPENARDLAEAGANVLVAGTSVFSGAAGVRAAISSLAEAANG